LGSLNRCAFVRLFRFCRLTICYAEQARIKWMMSLGDELGGPKRAKAMINAQGVSLILKSIEVHTVQEDRHVSRPFPFSPSFRLNHPHTAPNKLSPPPHFGATQRQPRRRPQHIPRRRFRILTSPGKDGGAFERGAGVV